MAYIEIHNVEKYYGKQHVLKNLSLSVEKGKFVTLLGASGCGKSTLLRILAGLTSIDSGAIYLGEEDITHLSPNKRNIGMIFQQYSLFPTMTVYDNVAFGLKMRKMNKAQIRSMVSEAIKMVNLEGSEKKYPSQLSGGEQQRVALARCIVTRPKVLLLDEPFSAIDAKLRKSLQSKIKEIHKELGMTSIFVTHDQDEAMVMSDYIYLLNSGVIEQEGTPIELYSKPRTIFAAEFIGDYNIIDGNFLSNITGKNFTCKKIAFRPELVKICKQPLYQHVDSIYFSGVIIDIVLQGNIVRYHVMVDKTKIKVDILSSQECLYNIGDNVYLSLQMSNIIQYAE
ncbi:ABC transporter ATP-binding protein [Lutispora thermophila]|uniref:ABC-type quaternary amine transporter n=1 Tax=Lutispora thermophila DSM 19022 TaxID=1122184 RepID=A0A1M6D2L2_9FIRM|nr:ABC transporter ATP-binding protein [Lutispora thermophila]SHI67476.1 putative spermidine/putrescine transport system ATP-binding protein [Lutispora thermophila DSM 19022]